VEGRKTPFWKLGSPTTRCSLLRVYRGIANDRILANAAAVVAFFALLAMFPAIAALVSVYGLFVDPLPSSSTRFPASYRVAPPK
jgi:uncharacterized BrkB/YihY/UPF0761 family membrane protein